MANVALAVKKRSVSGSPAKALRQAGLLPGVVYGRKQEPLAVEIPYPIFKRVYKQAGESTIVDLQVEQGVTEPVLIKDVQLDPVTDVAIHVDFIRLDMTQEIEATIPLVIVGVAPCVKDFGGILVQPNDKLQVKCLPAALVPEIAVDISSLAEFGDAIHVSDLKVPAGITVLTDAKTVLAQVSKPVEEVIEAAAPVAPEAPELLGKKEEAEAGAAEGEATKGETAATNKEKGEKK